MIRIPGQELGQLCRRLNDWEAWIASLARLNAAHSELSAQVSDGSLNRQLYDALRQAQESVSALQDRLHKARDLFEESDVEVGRSVGRVFDQFSMVFDTRCLESLHLAAVENDVHRLSLNGTLSSSIVPGVRTLDAWPEGGAA